MANKSKHRIVLAKLVSDSELIVAGRPDVGILPVFKQIQRPVAVVWKLNGSDQHLAAARIWAPTEGFTVFVYPTSERKPLERAKADIATSK